MNKIIEPLVNVDLEKGKLSGKEVIEVLKKLNDLKNVFGAEEVRAGMDQEQVIYEVQAHLPIAEGTSAGLFYGCACSFAHP